MTLDLERQLHEYASILDLSLPDVDADTIIAESVATPLVGPGGIEGTVLDRPPPRRAWVIAFVSAAAVLILGLLTLLSLDADPEGPVASQPSPSPTVTTPAPVPSAPIEGSVSGWSRVPHDESVFGEESSLRSVTEGGPGLVAVGADGCCADTDAAVWTSVDGITWSRVPEDEEVFGGGEMSSVTVGGPGLVAVGDGARGAAVWTSVDGITWSRVPEDEEVFGDATMSSVTAGGPGLVAVGGDGFNAVVWASSDGLVWSRVPHDVSVFGSAYIASVTAGGPGLVAVGWFEEDADENADEDAQPRSAAAVWTSVDGVAWSRVPHDETVLGKGMMSGVTAGGPGLVAVGSRDAFIATPFARRDDENGGPVWTSRDGLTWSRVPYDPDVWQLQRLASVTAGGPGHVAVGDHVWTSPDGISWSRVPPDPDFLVSDIGSVTVGGPGLVAVGSAGFDDLPAVWVMTIDD